MGGFVAGEVARERFGVLLDQVDVAYAQMRELSSDEVGNAFRVQMAERIEGQERTNRGLMYRVFAEIVDPPDEVAMAAAALDQLWARLRIAPKEIKRRMKLARRIRPRRRLTGPPALAPELVEVAAAVAAGAIGEDHLRIICYARDGGCTRPKCLEPGYHCEVHHSPDFGRGGATDADKLFFGCGPDHARVSRGQLRTEVTEGGRLGWSDGTGAPEINHAHHPEELLHNDPDPPENAG